MRLDLFSPGDNVLLVGEGNFSFSVGLRKHNMPIGMVSTCFEAEIFHEHHQEYIDFLEDNQVPVFLDVDARKLHEHPHIIERQYNKVVFNFPHASGTPSLQKNREFLKASFESATLVIKPGGQMLLTLCKGQGGTPFESYGRFEDSWQATEMSAHSEFVLSTVEPFVVENFPEYEVVAYRGPQSDINLRESLVHVFTRLKPTPYAAITEEFVEERLSLIQIGQAAPDFTEEVEEEEPEAPPAPSDAPADPDAPPPAPKPKKKVVKKKVARRPKPKAPATDPNAPAEAPAPEEEAPAAIAVPAIYSELYAGDPMKNKKSPVSFVKQMLDDELVKESIKIKHVTDEDITLYVASESGVTCSVNGVQDEFRLRTSPLQVLNQALDILEDFGPKNGFLFFPGMYFNPYSTRPFATEPPISYQFLFVGEGASTYSYRYIHTLTKKFGRGDVQCSLRPMNFGGLDARQTKEMEYLKNVDNNFQARLSTEWYYSYTEDEEAKQAVVAHVYNITYKGEPLDACVIFPDRLSEVFFKVKSWKELWALGSEVKMDNTAASGGDKPSVKQALLYPTTYEFDLTYRFPKDKAPNDEEVYEVLWLAAGQLIKKVDFLDDTPAPAPVEGQAPPPQTLKGPASKRVHITYQSLDMPLHQNMVEAIHFNVVGRALEKALKVAIS